ncbi:AraC family transcriptional regulator [Dysgonomonas gadei]
MSEELNFPNPSFFRRFFKQYVGMTPLQYKNS